MTEKKTLAELKAAADEAATMKREKSENLMRSQLELNAAEVKNETAKKESIAADDAADEKDREYFTAQWHKDQKDMKEKNRHE